MRLEHQIKDQDDKFQHRLVDLDSPVSIQNTPWVGYRTPAVYRPFVGRCGHFVAVTRYFQGSNEFPEPNLIYYVSGHDKGVINDLAECQMATEVMMALDEYVDSIGDYEDPDKHKDDTKDDRIKDFILYLQSRMETKR